MIRTTILSIALLVGLSPALAAEQQEAAPAGIYKTDPSHSSLVWSFHHSGLSNYTARFIKVDARLDKLKTDLKLTSAQQGAWQRYASFVREQAKQHREQFDKMREQTPPAHAPERLERMSEHMQLRMKSLEAMKEETRRFYDGLSESQKATFDPAMPQPRQGKLG